MTATALLTKLRRQGFSLAPETNNRLRVAPKSALTSELRELLARHKVELLAALSAETPILQMSLSKFGRKGCPIEVKVPGLPETLWFVPDSRHADAFVRKGITRGRIWTAAELTDLLKIPGLDADGAATIARVKAEFGAEVISVTTGASASASKQATEHAGEGRSG